MGAVRTTVMQPAYAIARRPRKGRVSPPSRAPHDAEEGTPGRRVSWLEVVVSGLFAAGGERWGLGLTIRSFQFISELKSRMCDFEYLPLSPKTLDKA